MTTYVQTLTRSARLRAIFTFVDLFCGAGGSIDGMVNAGGELVLGANHWKRAIETVSTNHPKADYLCADINAYDMRCLPKAQVLWASVICTEVSPAGGNKKHKGQRQFEELGHVPSAAYERTRACALDVVRATEVHRYDAVVVENVVEFARDWELYDWWVEGMCRLGYSVQVVNVSAAHVGGRGNAPAPQWRDRIFIVFTRAGVPTPDLELRPKSWCFACEAMVRGVQTWKRNDCRQVGRYGAQYTYRCPRRKCRHSIVEPLVLPAAAAIDWTDLGSRIGDRPKPLAEATMRRIRAGLEMFAQPVIAAAAGNTYEAGDYRRVWPAMESPLNARQGTGCDAVAVPPFMLDHMGGDVRYAANRVDPIDEPMRSLMASNRQGLVLPFITELRGGGSTARSIGDPLSTISAGGNHHGLTVPPGAFYMKNFSSKGPGGEMCKDVRITPLGSMTARDHHSLIVPYRRGRAKSTNEPLLTLGTRDSAGLCSIDVDPMDCNYRMLKPREHLNGQRFPTGYIVAGNQGEQTMQAGNAVPCNVAQWIGERLAAVLR